MKAWVLVAATLVLAPLALAEGERAESRRYVNEPLHTSSCSTLEGDVGEDAACFPVLPGESMATFAMVDDLFGETPVQWMAMGSTLTVEGDACGSATVALPPGTDLLVVRASTSLATLACPSNPLSLTTAGTITAAFR